MSTAPSTGQLGKLARGRGMLSAGAAWTPAQLSPTFDLDPLTLAAADGSAVSSYTSNGITLATTSTTHYPTLDRTHAINGRPALALASATPGELYTTTQGPTNGTGAFEMFGVAQLTSTTGADAQYPSLLLVGSGAGVNSQYALIGGRSGQWWIGGYDGAHLGAVAVAIDTSLHVYSLSFDGAGHVTARVDGVIIGTAATPLTLTLPQGLGISEWVHGSFGAADARIYRGLWYLSQAANLSLASRQKLEAYLHNLYGTVTPANMIASVGTSIVQGVPAFANSFVTYLTAQTGMSAWGTWYAGYPGDTSTQILSLIPTNGIQLQSSGCRAKNVAVLNVESINEQIYGVSTSTTLSNVASAVALLRSYGFKVVTTTSLPWINGTPVAFVQAQADTINAALRAGIPGTYGDAIADTASATVCPEMAISPGALNYDGINRQLSTDPDPGHPTATGANAIARVVAAAALTL